MQWVECAGVLLYHLNRISGFWRFRILECPPVLRFAAFLNIYLVAHLRSEISPLFFKTRKSGRISSAVVCRRRNLGRGLLNLSQFWNVSQNNLEPHFYRRSSKSFNINPGQNCSDSHWSSDFYRPTLKGHLPITIGACGTHRLDDLGRDASLPWGLWCAFDNNDLRIEAQYRASLFNNAVFLCGYGNRRPMWH
jgi:hypothetical protein